MTQWTAINKGDRRPLGRVLITYAWEDKIEAAMMGGEPEIYHRVVIGHWSHRQSKWLDDAGRSIDPVLAWAPLPEPYEGKRYNG